MTMNSQSIINVKSYGAVGDGIVDDTAAIQKCIDLAATQGGLVYFPMLPEGGLYKTTQSLIVRKGHIGFSGEGPRSAIAAFHSDDTIIFEGQVGKSLYANSIRDLAFSSYEKQGGHDIKATWVADFTIERVLGQAGAAGFHFHNFNNLLMRDVRLISYRTNYYGYLSGGGGDGGEKDRSDVAMFYNCLFGGGYVEGVSGLIVDGFVHTVGGVKLMITSCGGYGFYTCNRIGAENVPSFITLIGFESEFCKYEGIRLEAGVRCQISDVLLHGSLQRSNIYISNLVKNVTVMGGVTAGAHECGFACAGQDVTICGMQALENSNPEYGNFPGFLLGATSRGISMTGCRSGSANTSHWQRSGCQIDVGADDFVVSGNNFRNNIMNRVDNGAGSGPTKLECGNIF